MTAKPPAIDSGIGIITKADSGFYEGLAALLASVAVWHPGLPVRIVDCGLTNQQRERLDKNGFDVLQATKLYEFSVAPEMRHYYTHAIYGFFVRVDQLFPLTIHLDADTLVLGPLDVLLEEPLGGEPGIVATPDYPVLDLQFQIGTKDGVLDEVRAVIPHLDLRSRTFNGGVFRIQSSYYHILLEECVNRLLPLHNRLWGNDMAILNLAAYAACPNTPFGVLPHTYNTRPHYRRAPELRPPCIDYTVTPFPRLIGAFGPVRVLHFVGQMKPWHPGIELDDSIVAWRYYRDIARTLDL